ncbi:alpha/beta fold hydrolase [Mycobacterium sp. OTB74]|uniref:alpha/beta hydrolase n=1 Tax=Mycobacterium sp. OTB74 TaxID=1853452 RepID=UPI0024737222|nr:alpha/beta fold hydrolase [Mycobacterium sp. OTB74]MDH6243091.1 pimeloyl-ACP methyl ester carboxylesterase [Mycobacterium sp. OTB74]
MLEVIDKGVCTEAHPVPLLFLHGGCHAAWCWDEHFLDFFADNGFRAVALSYRGHGKSGLDKPLKKCAIADYLADARQVAAGLGTAPVLVGHSVGGFVIQKHFQDGHAPAAVLMASVPPQGIMRGAFRVWRSHPWTTVRNNIIGNNHFMFSTPQLAREHLFSPGTPEQIVANGAARVQKDSVRAVFTDMVVWRPKPMAVTAPVLVLGAEQDGTISNAEVHATARAFGTKAQLFPNMGHAMMLEPGWRVVAECIRNWLAHQGL